MKPQPYLFYSVVELADGSGPIFLEQDDSFEVEYSALFYTDNMIIGATSLNTIWYDFEKETFFKSIIELEPLKLYGGISMMILMGGMTVVWLANPNGCETVVRLYSEDTIVDNVNPAWEVERKKRLKSYNNKREVNAKAVSRLLKATQLQMKKYNYRYNFMVKGEEDLDLTLIKELLADGSMRQINEDSFLNYSDRARPSKIELGWAVGNDDYSAYFFMNESEQLGLFNRFYGLHAATKSDYIFNIDVDAKEYSLALFRQGLKEPVMIPESAYQLIVFKNKFEDYRSPNYNQPRGAWIW